MPATETLAQISDNLVYSAIAVYLLAMLAFAALSARQAAAAAAATRVLVGARKGSESGLADTRAAAGEERSATQMRVSSAAERQLAAVATALSTLGMLLLSGGVVARGLAAGRAPWGNMYEFAIVAALTTSATFLFFLRREPVRALGAWVTALVVLALGLAVTVLYTSAGALVPVLNSYWLVVHVAAAIISGGIFTVGAVATLLFRLRSRGERRSANPSGYAGALPAASTLHRVAHAAVLFAFPIWTFAVIAGAIWAENSWGRYWGWDPKETWAFITWVLYAAYLHAESTAGWRGTRAAWFALAGYAAFIFNFFGVNMWITGLHSYAGI
jgi:cytochrome c-type biogenesis protein CcsB